MHAASSGASIFLTTTTLSRDFIPLATSISDFGTPRSCVGSIRTLPHYKLHGGNGACSGRIYYLTKERYHCLICFPLPSLRCYANLQGIGLDCRYTLALFTCSRFDVTLKV